MAEVLQFTPSLNTEAMAAARHRSRQAAPWEDRVVRECSDARAGEAFWRQTDRAEGIQRLKELRLDFAQRAGEVAELIASVTPRLATPSAMTKEDTRNS